MVSASTPRLKKKPAKQWTVTTRRMCGEVIATSAGLDGDAEGEGEIDEVGHSPARAFRGI